MQKKMPQAREFDLNLLRIFEEIYKFGSVKKAAQSLKQSPPAVSQSLQKLRVYFSDPLFVRNGMKLTATTTADAIHQQLSKKFNGLVDSLESLVTATSKDLLIVHCSIYFSLRFLPLIAAWVEEHAPGCKIIHRDFLRHQHTSEDLLLLRGVDLVFDVVPAYHFSLKTHLLVKEAVTFVCRREHPRLGSQLSLEEAKQEKFAHFDSLGVDIQLNQVNLHTQMGERDFAFVSTSVPAICSVIATTNTVGVIPVWMYEKFRHTYDIRALANDITLEPIPVYMMYSKTSLQNDVFSNLINWLESDVLSTHTVINNASVTSIE
ncbi:LysR family transcriptional regulator [Ewingella americana]|uniref:LysR family transcriptional regulator n=1 Tax=Ewingella americana TaxID=41202 RepID=UPI0012AD2DCB|nr:LysR family transcriptional regulator [Ewingella americana]MRT03206.1 LysR family transcriptional regulator [Ewingella americana]